MNYKIDTTKQYMRDVKLAKRQGLPLERLAAIIRLLEKGSPLPPKNKDHQLTGNFAGYRECHISPDWLLIYKKDTAIRLITLIRTGTHSELFK